MIDEGNGLIPSTSHYLNHADLLLCSHIVSLGHNELGDVAALIPILNELLSKYIGVTLSSHDKAGKLKLLPSLPDWIKQRSIVISALGVWGYCV